MYDQIYQILTDCFSNYNVVSRKELMPDIAFLKWVRMYQKPG